jgi:hypothetical protein
MAERVLASRVTIVPLETLENVLTLTASVKRGSSGDSVSEEETMDGDLLRGDGVLESCSSRGRRRSGLVHHVRHLE